MNPFEFLAKTAARIAQPIVNAANKVVQAVLPDNPIAKTVQNFTNTVNSWAAPAPTSTSDRLRDTQTDAYHPSRASSYTPTSTSDILRDTGTPAYTNGSASTVPRAPTRTQVLEQRARESSGFGGQLTQHITPTSAIAIRAHLLYLFATVNGYDYSIADAVKHLDDASMKRFSYMLIANKGDMALTIEQFFGSWYREDVTEEEAALIQQMVQAAHEEHVRRTPERHRRGDVRVSLSDQVRSATTTRTTTGYQGVSFSDYARFEDWRKRSGAGIVEYNGQVGVWTYDGFQRIEMLPNLGGGDDLRCTPLSRQ